MTRSLAAELALNNIRVNCLRPGGMSETNMIQDVQEKMSQAIGIPKEQFAEMVRQGILMKRTITLDEVARYVSFFVSDFAKGVTGQVVNVDCGEILH